MSLGRLTNAYRHYQVSLKITGNAGDYNTRRVSSLRFQLHVSMCSVDLKRGNLFLSHQARKRSSGAGSGSAESLRRLSGYTEYFPKAIADFAQAPLIEPDNVEIHREMEDLIRCTARN